MGRPLPAVYRSRRQDPGVMRKREFFERDLMWGEVMERLLTIEETAQALKVKKTWLYTGIHAGTLAREIEGG